MMLHVTHLLFKELFICTAYTVYFFFPFPAACMRNRGAI